MPNKPYVTQPVFRWMMLKALDLVRADPSRDSPQVMIQTFLMDGFYRSENSLRSAYDTVIKDINDEMLGKMRVLYTYNSGFDLALSLCLNKKLIIKAYSAKDYAARRDSTDARLIRKSWTQVWTPEMQEAEFQAEYS